MYVCCVWVDTRVTRICSYINLYLHAINHSHLSRFAREHKYTRLNNAYLFFAYLRYIYVISSFQGIYIYICMYIAYIYHVCTCVYKCIDVYSSINILIHIYTHVWECLPFVFRLYIVLDVAIKCTYSHTQSLSLSLCIFFPLLMLLIHSNNTLIHATHSLFFPLNIYLSVNSNVGHHHVTLLLYFFLNICSFTEFFRPTTVTVSYSHTLPNSLGYSWAY